MKLTAAIMAIMGAFTIYGATLQAKFNVSQARETWFTGKIYFPSEDTSVPAQDVCLGYSATTHEIVFRTHLPASSKTECTSWKIDHTATTDSTSPVYKCVQPVTVTKPARDVEAPLVYTASGCSAATLNHSDSQVYNCDNPTPQRIVQRKKYNLEGCLWQDSECQDPVIIDTLDIAACL